jgi:hypothetical protein
MQLLQFAAFSLKVFSTPAQHTTYTLFTACHAVKFKASFKYSLMSNYSCLHIQIVQM